MGVRIAQRYLDDHLPAGKSLLAIQLTFAAETLEALSGFSPQDTQQSAALEGHYESVHKYV
jgi:hypothetical protein